MEAGTEEQRPWWLRVFTPCFFPICCSKDRTLYMYLNRKLFFYVLKVCHPVRPASDTGVLADHIGRSSGCPIWRDAPIVGFRPLSQAVRAKRQPQPPTASGTELNFEPAWAVNIN